MGKEKLKCYSCGRKITLVQSLCCLCKCNNVYCVRHRYPEEHGCIKIIKIKEHEIQPVLKDKITNRI